MNGAGMKRGNRQGVEQAEAHRARRLGMMTWWAHGTERVLGVCGHDLARRVDGGADDAQSGVPTSRRHGGVRVQPIVVSLREGGANRPDTGARMRAVTPSKIDSPPRV